MALHPRTGTETSWRALVTGGNRGIGLEVVKSILEDDERRFVFLGCRDLQGGRSLVDSLCQVYGQRVQALQLDVTSPESIATAVETVESGGQQLDLLVNNAGILLEADGAQFDIENVRQTVRVNFEGTVAVTTAFMPLLLRAPDGAHILSTSSGCGTRTLGLLSEQHRAILTDVNLDIQMLRKTLAQLVDTLENQNSTYHSIPSVGYGFSKMAVNCFTQLMARDYPSLYINACSPGFCNTDMCANYNGQRKPKDPSLGASVFSKVLFGDLGKGKTGLFFKENSKADTPLDQADSVIDPWVAAPGK